MTYGTSPPASAVKAPARRNLTAIGLFIVMGMDARLGGEKKSPNRSLDDLAPFATQGRPSQNGMSLGLSGVVPGLENSTPRAVS